MVLPIWALALSYVVISLAAMIIGHYIGWNQGVKDTERRWADAVGRKEPLCR